MSEIPLSGTHLSHMDIQDAVPTTEFRTSFVGNVKYYGGIVLSITSDVDLSIVVEWSADGVVFVPDLDRIISFDGTTLEGFYERNVIGEYVRFIGTNTSGVSGNVFIQTYAKIRATGNFDDGVNIDNPIIPPPVEDVWWYRDAADLSQSTILKLPVPGDATDPGALGGLLYGEVNQINILDPTQDSRAQTVFLGGNPITLDYQNLTATNYGRRDRAFYRCGGILNGAGVTFNGPDLQGVVAMMCSSAVFAGNSGPAFRNALALAVNNSLVINLKNTLASSIYNSTLIGASDNVGGQPDGFYGNNILLNIFSSTIRRNASPAGANLRRNVTNRFYNSSILKEFVTSNYFCCTRVRANVLTAPHTLEGLFVITDDSFRDDASAANSLNITGTVDTVNKFHARFSNGYDFWTDVSSTIGLRINPNSSTVSPICDVRYKQDLKEYTDTKGVLDRMVTCKVQTYHNISLMKSDPVKEGSEFRITATAQDLNYVFHPEEGDADTINAKAEEKCCNDYRKNRKLGIIRDLEDSGEKDPEKELTPQEEAYVDETIEEELKDPNVIRDLTKESLQTLNMQEYISALHLCIKELSSQLDTVKSRLNVLEKIN